jgi:ABC-type amino acid transport substrate-binding protein
MKSNMVATALLTLAFVAHPPLTHAEELLADVARAWLTERKVIIVSGQDAYPPFEFVDQATREYTGLTIELIRWIASEFGFTAVFVPSTFAEAQNAVLEGRADAITGMFRSAGRESRFDFSSEMFPIPASIFARGERVDIKDARTLVGKRIAVQRGDFAVEFLESSGIAVEFVYAEDFRSALALVVAGNADALIGDEQIVERLIRDYRLGNTLKKVSDPLYIGQLCLAVPKGDSILLSVLNAGIKHARDNGTLEKIYMKWTGSSLTGGSRFRITSRTAGLFAVIVSSALAAGLVLMAVVKKKVRSLVEAAREDLERTVASLRDENARLAGLNATLRRDVEERSRLEEEKRRIDAEVAARRVEELTRCAIAAALESTQSSTDKNE